MKTFKIVLILLATLGCSQKISHTKHTQEKLSVPYDEFMYIVLQNTPEYFIHNSKGAKNKVYISQDGHSEAVYDENGNIVEDCENMGSFNYYHPQKKPIRHFYFDIIPWLKSGNCENDTTSLKERVNAYVNDLEIGHRRGMELIKRSNVLVSVNLNEDQISKLSLFKKASFNFPSKIFENGHKINLIELENNFEAYKKSLNEGIYNALDENKKRGLSISLALWY